MKNSSPPALLRTAAFATCITALLTSLSPAAVQADVIYRFQSPPYYFVKNYDVPCAAGDCLLISSGERVQGWFSLASPLPANHSISTDIGAQVTGWSFSNGTTNLASAPARPDVRVLGFRVATDAQGRIVHSLITVSRWADGKAGPHARDSRVEFMEIENSSPGMVLFNSPCNGVATTEAGVTDACLSFPITAETSRGVYDRGGTWTLDAPLASIGDVSITEGDAGTLDLTFTVTLTKAPTSTASLQWRTVDGTAKAPADYAADHGTLTWAADDASPKTIVIKVQGDTLAEADETFTVQLDNFVGMAGGDSTQGTGTIVNNDAALPPSGTAQSIPTLSQWGMALLSLALPGFAALRMRRSRG